MTIIESDDALTYDQPAGVFFRKTDGVEIHEAYVRVGFDGKNALIIRQKSGTELTAIRALLKKIQSFMNLVEGAANDAFLAIINAEAADQMAQLKALMGEPEDKDPESQPS